MIIAQGIVGSSIAEVYANKTSNRVLVEKFIISNTDPANDLWVTVYLANHLIAKATIQKDGGHAIFDEISNLGPGENIQLQAQSAGMLHYTISN